MTELRPGTSPPPVRMPIRFFAMTTPLLHFHGLLRKPMDAGSLSRGGDSRRGWGCTFAESLHDLRDDFARMSNDRNNDRMFVRLRLFEGCELAVEQRGWHEMPIARRQPARDQVPLALEIDDTDIGAIADQDIAISPFERRARDGAMIADTPRRVDPGRNAMQPGPAILIGEWHAAMHLLDVRRRVEPVALLEDPIQPVGEHRRNRALAAAGDSHHHDDGNISQRQSGFGVGL